MKKLFKHILTVWIFFAGLSELHSQIIFLPADSAKFKPGAADSVFIFADDLAVTASGNNLQGIRFKDSAICGENMPPTLQLRKPMGAILYHQDNAQKEIPVIIGRQNGTLPIEQLLRKYFLRMERFKGHSEKGGIRINVWQKRPAQIPFLIFLKDGKILGNVKAADSTPTKNYSNFEINNLPLIEKKIAGVWIHPPETGVNRITGQILQLLQAGPLLVEFWDGLGWQYFEQGYLSHTVVGKIGKAKLGYALFPPETVTNYAAMVYGGLPADAASKNLFHGLDALKIDYLVLEGEKLVFPIPGNIKLHTGNSPEEKDEAIFRSALAAIENSLPLLFLHYHGLDDLNHSFGPYDKRTVAHLNRLWQWHRELRKQWTGNILLISDHGAHPVENEKQLNRKFIDKGTKGSHGDFIFADMAVPIIEVEGKGEKPVTFELSAAQSREIWQMLGQPISVEADESAAPTGILQIFVQNDTLSFGQDKDRELFGQDFYFDYFKKGKQLSGQFKGILLADLLKNYDLSKIKQIIAHSFDGHRAAFSLDDLLQNKLAVALNRSPETTEKAFTLYPLKDKFPNRIMKQLKVIEIF